MKPMLLRSLSLRNIRSYQEASIDFPEGSVLLSGDVGSGKTSILLAVEFALFGIQRGELAASSLLRHGEDEGEVTLACELGGKDVIITRTLKREGESIKQGPGKIVIDGSSQSLTPVELKAHVLELLGYPHELLAKGKSLIFRYTVYTPQEEMKKVLFDDPDQRLETLRKVFCVDQYRRARDNASVLARELRLEERALQVQLEEFPHKRKSLEEAKKASEELTAARRKAQEEMAMLEDRRKEEEEHLRKAQGRREEFLQTMQSLQTLEREAKELAARRQQLEQASRELGETHERLSAEKPIIPDDASVALEKKEAARKKVEERVLQAKREHAKTEAVREDVQRNREELSSLAAQCPLCKQDVPHEHKERLLEEQKRKDEEAAASQQRLTSFIKEADAKLDELSSSIKELREQQLRRAAAIERQRSVEQRCAIIAKQREQVRKELKEQEERAARNDEDLKRARMAFEQLKPAKEHYEKQQERAAAAQRAARDAQVLHARKDAELQAAMKAEERLQAELERLDAHRERSQLLHAHLHWLKECFVPAAEAMEQVVFSSLHRECSELFGKWFGIIIDDESLRVRLDSSFSPVVELNGYETEPAALSGGERTAVALAYRLSLNQVINEFITTIQTRELLILDEPTDGFSSHQLDRMRDVLDQLRLRQLILVSHEPKMEGFVEHVIRVGKQEHSSTLS